jgi:hypothetical protein
MVEGKEAIFAGIILSEGVMPRIFSSNYGHARMVRRRTENPFVVE